MLLLKVLFSHRITQIQIIVSLLLTTVVFDYTITLAIHGFISRNPMRQENRIQVVLPTIEAKHVGATQFILSIELHRTRPNTAIISGRIVVYRLNLVSNIMIKKQFVYAVCLGCQFQSCGFSLQ